VWSGYFDHVDSSLAPPAMTSPPRTHMELRGRSSRLWHRIVSRWPVTNTASVRFAQASYDTRASCAPRARPALEARRRGLGPLDFLRKKTRWRKVEILRQTLSERTHPLIIAGDFNCEWQDATCVSAERDLGLAGLPAGRGRAHLPEHAKSARLILVSQELAFDSYRTIATRSPITWCDRRN